MRPGDSKEKSSAKCRRRVMSRGYPRGDYPKGTEENG